MATLVPTEQAFYGIILGTGSTPVGRVSLLVTFGTLENYRTEHINFEVASFKTSYHAILRRPTLTRFMVVPNHTYLVLNMPEPNGVLSIYGDMKTSHSCEKENIDIAAALEHSWNTILLADSTRKLP